MKRNRLGSVGVLVVTATLTLACFVGPACGCGAEGSPTSEGLDSIAAVGASDVNLAACDPTSWDMAAAIDKTSVLTVFPHVVAVEEGDLYVTLTAGERTESFVVGISEPFEPFPTMQITIHQGNLVTVSFTATSDTTLDWEYKLGDGTGDEALVTLFDDADAPMPEACI